MKPTESKTDSSITAVNRTGEALGSPEEFMAELRDLARETAPRLFALCEEFGDRHDAQVEYWGMAFDD
ncbi:hypothetical protein SAMN05216215_1009202 [Saccharopolyspora shandongensis]|uniref:Uncharacterized protein n=1 Tax=Saccharopolyspora shandongensis TaxID=418495 RepID=A0A1H3ANH9_9PSEU|nr:hypothetical protein SAMN05216215_1009202 [Saccharopolyspora shandongensis]